MIFAAGLGTRLGSLTRETPKALVSVGGVPMLEHVALRLIEAGVDRIIINVHHFAEQIVDFVEARRCFGVEVVFSLELERPLETGGGLAHAGPLFRGDGPILLHNADILSEVPLHSVIAAHGRTDAVATLVVMHRQSSRQLLFDDAGLLGRVDDLKGVRTEVRDPQGVLRTLAFGGIHVVSREIFSMIEQRGVFSIIDTYLGIASKGRRILPFDGDTFRWMDVGKREQLEAAERLVSADRPVSAG